MRSTRRQARPDRPLTGSLLPGSGRDRPAVDTAGIGLGGSSGASWDRMVANLVGTTAAVTLAMAFIFFGKRRRDGDAPDSDDALSMAAATGSGAVATATLIAGSTGTAVLPFPVDAELAMPRWRRPSLLEARRADPTADRPRRHPADVRPWQRGRGGRAWSGGSSAIGSSRLLDAPDEIRGAEIGILDRDDEVQLVERSGTYWRVLCPDGGQGWVHQMTLGEVVDDDADDQGLDDDSADLDDDVLSAFLASRARRD